MDEDALKEGYLRIGNENDRNTVAAILYKNGYTVSPVRRKKNGKTFEYFVRYTVLPMDIQVEGKPNEG